jgi:chemotaxis response regulator CheB
MRRIRTVAVTITPLLCDIISELVAERAPIDMVACLDSRDQLELLLQTLAPDLVLIGLCPSEGDGIVRSLSNALPWAKVIALSHDTSHAFVHVPPHHRTPLIDISPKALIETIRGF